jgi:hypothetical protein
MTDFSRYTYETLVFFLRCSDLSTEFAERLRGELRSRDRALAHQEVELEQLKCCHIAAEGRNAWNDNPDGCYYCGSPHHHSSDCQDAEAQV